MRLELTLYGRSGCHLCEDMQMALQSFLADRPVHVRVVDIDGDAVLGARYGLYIPVLMAEDREICHYVLDREALQTYLDAHIEAPASPT